MKNSIKNEISDEKNIKKTTKIKLVPNITNLDS